MAVSELTEPEGNGLDWMRVDQSVDAEVFVTLDKTKVQTAARLKVL